MLLDEGIEGGLCSGAGSFECLDVLLCDLCLDHIGIGCADLRQAGVVGGFCNIDVCFRLGIREVELFL